MSIALELERIVADRDTIRSKFVELGISASNANLDALATAAEGIIKRGAANISIVEGDSYTIPAGYHDGSGTVQAVAGGGNYNLQAKTVTPTTTQQSITSDTGYYGLSSVVVNAIPLNYQDVSSVDAEAGDVLTGKIFVASDGTVVAGTMVNNGTITTKTLSGTTLSYTIPKGYHSGSGKVQIVLEEKSVTPTKEEQVITPSANKVLSKVTVAAIPDEYITTTDADAVAANILVDKTAYVGGVKVTGTMADNGTVTQTLNTTTTSYTIAAGKHSGSGKVSITLEEKSATPTKSTQNITPTSGKVLSKVTVNPIPANYITTTDATAVATDMILNKTAYVNGVKVTGTMASNGDTSGSIDGISTMSTTIPAGYTSGGTVTLTSDIEDRLKEI